MDIKNDQDYIEENDISDEELDKEYLKLFMEKLERSKDDFKNGRCMTLEESRARLQKKYEELLLKRNG